MRDDFCNSNSPVIGVALTVSVIRPVTPPQRRKNDSMTRTESKRLQHIAMTQAFDRSSMSEKMTE